MQIEDEIAKAVLEFLYFVCCEEAGLALDKYPCTLHSIVKTWVSDA